MRHGRKLNHLGRTTTHRKAMYANMATSLILHKRIKTTLAKAKALRKYVEPILTKTKTDTTHSRRLVFKKLRSKDGVKEAFSQVAGKIAARPGGYTRILKTGYRLGDSAETCIIELVDFSETFTAKSGEGKAAGKKRTRRGKKQKGAKAETAAADKKGEDGAKKE